MPRSELPPAKRFSALPKKSKTLLDGLGKIRKLGAIEPHRDLVREANKEMQLPDDRYSQEEDESGEN
jgi:hypothetical protein